MTQDDNPEQAIASPEESALSEEAALSSTSPLSKCPLCGSEDIRYDGPFDTDFHYVYQTVTCSKCRTKWDENYSFANISDFVAGKKPQEEAHPVEYRTLLPGEVIEEGDEWFWDVGKQWIKVYLAVGAKANGTPVVRRRIQ